MAKYRKFTVENLVDAYIIYCKIGWNGVELPHYITRHANAWTNEVSHDVQKSHYSWLDSACFEYRTFSPTNAHAKIRLRLGKGFFGNLKYELWVDPNLTPEERATPEGIKKVELGERIELAWKRAGFPVSGR